MNILVETNWRKYCLICFIVIASLTMEYCAVGMYLSKTQNFTGNYSIELDKTPSNILSVIEDSGKSMALRVSEFDEAQGIISLAKDPSVATGSIIGKFEESKIRIKTLDAGKKLEVSVLVTGNFGKGSRETADKIFNEFRTKLLERVEK